MRLLACLLELQNFKNSYKMKKETNDQTTTKPMAYDALLGTVPDDEKEKPYCTDCGNDDLAYIDQYANGEYWRCKECGKEFIW